ncbi:MAG: GDP-mannose 4,6-dehydratase, partial [Candidatus Moranbacteria bacterium GW2011_GWD2_37_9]
KKEKEVGIDENTKKIIIRIDPRYYRPTEVDLLLGDPTKAAKELKWKPKTKFKELVKIMMKADMKKES